MVDLTTYSRNSTTSTFNDEQLKRVYDVVTKVSKEEYGFTPVIAGGSVRDTLLGVPYRDIDVFFLDAPPIEENTDDFLVYVTEMVRKDGGLDTHGIANPLNFSFANQSYESLTGFSVYELYTRNPENVLQFMAAPSSKTIDELIEGFDYDLVRCWYDGEYHVHPDFDKAVKAGRVETKNKKTWERARRWRDRTGYRIVVGNPPKAKASGYAQYTATPTNPGFAFLAPADDNF